MGNAESSSVSAADLGKLSLSQMRAIFSRFDKKHEGALGREEGLSFLAQVLRKEGRTGPETKKGAEELFARLDKNNDDVLSWQELTGVSFKRAGARQMVSFQGDLDSALKDSPIGWLNKDERFLLVQRLCCVAPVEVVAMVCKQFHFDIATLQSFGLIATSEVRQFDPRDASDVGQITCPFPTLTPQQLQQDYAGEPWLPSMLAYCEEMRNRQLDKFGFEQIVFLTDGPEVDLKVVLAIDGKKIRTLSLVDAAHDMFFIGGSNALVQEAAGEKPKQKRPEHEGFWNELLYDKYNTYERRVRSYEEHNRFMAQYGPQLVKEASENDAAMAKASRMRARMLRAHDEYPYPEVPPGTKYGTALVTITVFHKALIVGSVSLSLSVYGWLQSEHKCDAETLAVKFLTLTPPASRQVDPSFLGARTQIIISGVTKQIR